MDEWIDFLGRVIEVIKKGGEAWACFLGSAGYIMDWRAFKFESLNCLVEVFV